MSETVPDQRDAREVEPPSTAGETVWSALLAWDSLRASGSEFNPAEMILRALEDEGFRVARQRVANQAQIDVRPHKHLAPWPDYDVLLWRCEACGEYVSETGDNDPCPVQWRTVVPLWVDE